MYLKQYKNNTTFDATIYIVSLIDEFYIIKTLTITRFCIFIRPINY